MRILKVGLFTLDAKSYNYGGLLQEYALFVTVQNLDIDVEVINYDVSSEQNTFSYKRNLKYLSLSKLYRKMHKNVMGNRLVYSTIPNEESRKLFDKFRIENMVFSEKYTYKDLYYLGNLYDGYICGSDQIWNPTYNIPSFFLNFVERSKKIIYAASIGVSDLSRIERNVYEDLLVGLEYISVREESAKKIIEELTHISVEIVLDPTLLLKKEDWLKLISKDEISEPYLFCYYLGENKKKIQAAKRIASKYGLKIISVPFEQCMFSEEEFPTYDKGIGPVEFLNLIYNANFVLTDSFHASVFSIIFDKNFRVFSRDFGKKNMNDRLYTLLKMINRLDLFIMPENIEMVQSNTSCSYDLTLIKELQKMSKEWLKKALYGKDEEKII